MENIIEPQRKTGSTNNTIKSSLPFNLSHPELNLIPYSEIAQKYGRAADEITWGFSRKPEYVECPNEGGTLFLYMARKGKIGIVKLYYKENFWGTIKPHFQVIIKCKFDRIEKQRDMFVCYKGSSTQYIDLQGVVMN